MVDWSDIEPFVAHVPTARLKSPSASCGGCTRPSSQIVEAASHDEGEEIIRAVGVDRELEADVFEELDTEHQLEFLRARSDDEAARLLSVMAPDDAVDLLTELAAQGSVTILSNVRRGCSQYPQSRARSAIHKGAMPKTSALSAEIARVKNNTVRFGLSPVSIPDQAARASVAKSANTHPTPVPAITNRELSVKS